MLKSCDDTSCTMKKSIRCCLDLIYTILFLHLFLLSIGSSIKPTTSRPPPPPAPNIPCVQRSHCNSIGLNREEKSGDPLPFYARNCFCDDVCLMYRDCCSDYSGLQKGPGSDLDLQNERDLDLSLQNSQVPGLQSGQASDLGLSNGGGVGTGLQNGRDLDSGLQKEHKKIKQNAIRNHITCQRVEMIDTSYEMYIVASCPSKFKDEFVRSRCEDEHLSLDDLFLRLPVADRGTGVLYRNIYCAICTNKKDEINVIYWLPVYTCDSSAASLFFSDASIRFTLSELRGVTTRCRVEIQPPLGIDSPRKCKSHIDYCPRKSKGDSKCRNGPTAYVYHRLQVFKNRFCAQCHRLEMTDVQCEDGRTPWIEFDSGYFNSADPKPEVSSYPNNMNQHGVIIFSIDVAMKSGNLTNPTGNSRNISIGDSCSGKGVVLDPFRSECRLVGCEDGWKFSNGECVVDLDYTPPTTISTTTTTTTIPTTVATTTTSARMSLPIEPKIKASTTKRTPKSKKTTIGTTTAQPPIENAWPTVPVFDTSVEIDKLLNFKLNSEQEFDHDLEFYEPEMNVNGTIDNLQASTTRRQSDYPDFYNNPIDAIDLSSPDWFGAEFPTTVKYSTDETRYRQTTRMPRSTTLSALKYLPADEITSRRSGKKVSHDNINDDEDDNDYGSAEPNETLERATGDKTTKTPKREGQMFEMMREMYDQNEELGNANNKSNSQDKNLQKVSLTENRSSAKNVQQPNMYHNYKLTGTEFQYISDTDDKVKSESNPDENMHMLYVNGDNDTFKYMVVFQYRPIEGLIAFFAGISSICALIGALLALIVLPTRYPDIDRKPVGGLVISLLLSQIAYLLALIANSPQGSQVLVNSGCFYIAALLHYFFFVSFLCMNVLAIDLCRITFTSNIQLDDKGCTNEARFSAYSSYAWITPVLVVITGVMLDVSGLENIIRPHYGDSNICWITGSYNQLMLFALPLVIITLADSILFVITAHRLCTAATSHDDVRRFRRWLLLCVGLCVCICATWMCAFGAAFYMAGERIGHIAFIVLFATQGLISCAMTLSLSRSRRHRAINVSRNDDVWKVDNSSKKKKLKNDKMKDCKYMSLNSQKTEILSQETSI